MSAKGSAMPDLERLSFTIEKPLLGRLEKLMRRAKFRNRSEFIRDLIRSRLVETQWEGDEEALGTVTLIYDHETRQLSDKLTSLQHEHHHAILATTHVHLDHHLCAEMIMCRGRAHILRELSEQLGQQKGVLHSQLAMSSTGKQLR
jgi:CopG family nickel-responsive transcriptional regulator